MEGLSTGDFFHLAFYPLNVLSTGYFLRGGFAHWVFCPLGILSTMDFVH